MRTQPDIQATTGGYLPVVVIDKPIADRMASTVRHNRARGKHSVGGMTNLVFGMLKAGESDEAVMTKMGLEPEELVRLKYTTGFAKLFDGVDFGKAWVTDKQIEIKRDYKASHPDAEIPPNT
ncbi:hypothetical protein D3C76_1593000 [compost metagenome]